MFLKNDKLFYKYFSFWFLVERCNINKSGTENEWGLMSVHCIFAIFKSFMLQYRDPNQFSKPFYMKCIAILFVYNSLITVTLNEETVMERMKVFLP